MVPPLPQCPVPPFSSHNSFWQFYLFLGPSLPSICSPTSKFLFLALASIDFSLKTETQLNSGHLQVTHPHLHVHHQISHPISPSFWLTCCPSSIKVNVLTRPHLPKTTTIHQPPALLSVPPPVHFLWSAHFSSLIPPPWFRPSQSVALAFWALSSPIPFTKPQSRY